MLVVDNRLDPAQNPPHGAAACAPLFYLGGAVGRLVTIKPRVAQLGARVALPGWTDPRRGTRHERGYGTAWDALRLAILQRDAGLCVPCRTAGRVTPATEVDHVVNRARGGTDDPANLQSICMACHNAKTARESAGSRTYRLSY